MTSVPPPGALGALPALGALGVPSPGHQPAGRARLPTGVGPWRVDHGMPEDRLGGTVVLGEPDLDQDAAVFVGQNQLRVGVVAATLPGRAAPPVAPPWMFDLGADPPLLLTGLQPDADWLRVLVHAVTSPLQRLLETPGNRTGRPSLACLHRPP